ncbi:SelT/SelW/SelH family protein [Marinoscillum sp. MHG1-6]|uniref:SelT/SelW/SelH family protein n=1 Tax=Marinoscillum sp. MHG1-6 TaxID=2959627 RepID=UPI0021572444|nr:Rdx family protein [Marinoscillum sp. MHG1-6]
MNIITIEFCSQCRWMHRATWMMQELFTTFEQEVIEIRLRQTAGGNFNIYVDDQLLFSRKENGRFPEITELKQLIRDQIAPDMSLGHSDKK